MFTGKKGSRFRWRIEENPAGPNLENSHLRQCAQFELRIVQFPSAMECGLRSWHRNRFTSRQTAISVEAKSL